MSSSAPQTSPGSPARTLSAGGDLFWILFTVGLIVRLVSLPLEGTNDMRTIIGWGDSVRSQGFVHAYHGIYFPLEYLYATGASWARDTLGISATLAMKIPTLACDLGAFFLLVHLLRAWGLDRRYALIYWLHPFFLAIFELGYIDAHMAVCLLAALALFVKPTRGRTYLAGVALALGLFTKPQMIPIVGVSVLLALCVVLITREREPLFQMLRMLVAPLALMAIVCVLFATGGERLSTVPYTYTPGALSDQSPGLTGNMLNIWTPVVVAERKGSEPLYAVEKPAIANPLGILIGGLLILAGAVAVARRRRAFTSMALVEMYAITAAVVPIFLTHAHENHFYLAGLMGSLVVAWQRDRRLTLLLCVLLAVQWVNLSFRYGLGLTDLTQTGWIKSVTDAYVSHTAVQVIGAVLTVVLAVTWLVRLYRPRSPMTSI